MSTQGADKRAFIAAYLDSINGKIDTLAILASKDFGDEAVTLCLVYIDGLARALCSSGEPNRCTYVRALGEHSGDVELGLVHPLQLARALEALKPKWHSMAAAVRAAFPGPKYELHEAAVGLKTLDGHLAGPQLSLLEREVWRGTVAAVAYYSMRNPAVHRLGPGRISFDHTSFDGKPARSLELPRLLAAAKTLAAEARRRSLEAGEWIGNDPLARDA